MTMPFFLRPSTVLREIDLTQIISAPSSSIGCVFGEFHRGPMKPTYINGYAQRLSQLYGGVADPKIGFAYDTAQAFLAQSGNLLIQRVTNNALYAGIHVYLDDSGTEGRLDFVSFTATDDDFSQGAPGVDILNWSADMIAANSFTMNITDGVTSVATTPVVYATSHSNTMNLIAAAIQTALNTFGNGGLAEVLPALANGNKRRLAIHYPPGVTLQVSSPVVTLGTTQAQVTVDTADSNRIMTIMSENPGAWGNDIGVKLTGRDLGTRQRIRLLFSDKLRTGNSFTATINGTAIASPVVFATDSDTTMAAIATALTAHASVSSAYVETVPAGRDNDRSIIVIAEKAGAGQLVVDSVAVTSGTTPPAVTTFNVLNGQAPDNSFVLEVYNRSNVNIPDERFVVTLGNNVDSKGVQTRIDARINTATDASLNIRVIPNPAFVDSDTTELDTINGFITDPDFDVPTTIRWLTGGDDGLTVLSSQLRTAIQSLDDRVHYPFSILMNGGYTATEVQQEMVALCEKRVDCFAILDMPSDKQGAQAAYNYRMFELNIDSAYGAIYTPDVLIADIATGERRFVPPSGYIGAVFAYNDRVADVAHAPAGLNRGGLKGVLGLRVLYKPGDEEMLWPVGINCVVDRPQIGPVIMGEETLQSKKSLLSSIHARRLVSNLEVAIVDGLDYTLFEPNNEFTRNQAVQLGNGFLKPYKNNGALYDYRIQCNDKNNPPEIIDQDALSYRVFLKVVRAIKGILLDVVLTRTGANFTELEGQTF